MSTQQSPHDPQCYKSGNSKRERENNKKLNKWIPLVVVHCAYEIRLSFCWMETCSQTTQHIIKTYTKQQRWSTGYMLQPTKFPLSNNQPAKNFYSQFTYRMINWNFCYAVVPTDSSRMDWAIRKRPPQRLLYSTMWIWQSTIPVKMATGKPATVFRICVWATPTTRRHFENMEH